MPTSTEGEFPNHQTDSAHRPLNNPFLTDLAARLLLQTVRRFHKLYTCLAAD